MPGGPVTFTDRTPGSIPGQGSEMLHAVGCGQNFFKKIRQVFTAAEYDMYESVRTIVFQRMVKSKTIETLSYQFIYLFTSGLLRFSISEWPA